ncbi:MAG: type II secretion system F family protein [bacterium]
MKSYNYIGIDNNGARCKGTIEAASFSEACSKLSDIHIIKVEKPFMERLRDIATYQRSHEKDIGRFLKGLAMLLRSGQNISRSLEVLKISFPKWDLNTVSRNISQGVSLGEALQSIFHKRYDFLNILSFKWGSQEYIEVIQNTADHIKHKEDLKKSITKALFYPMTVLAVSILSLLVLVVYVLPQYSSIFSNMDIKIPALTQAIIAIGTFILDYGNIMLLVLLSVVVVFIISLSFEKGRDSIDVFTFKLPFFGNIKRYMLLQRFAKVLSLLLGAGIPLNNALKAASNTIASNYLSQILNRIGAKIKQGTSFGTAIAKEKFFPDIVSEMAVIGEESSDLSKVMSELSGSFEDEAKYQIERFAMIAEPLAILIVGLIVAVFVIGMFMPIIELTRVLQQ